MNPVPVAAAKSYGNIGICLAMLGRKEDALKALDTALSIDPDYLPAVNNRILVESIKEGEELGEEKFMAIDFNRAKFLMDLK